ncbi:MAG: hypothetical protein J2P37_36085 [Ktedonobacteraceae bacterium]|nr:hypothetical protein [Ktedonobacteraceae bacterium]
MMHNEEQHQNQQKEGEVPVLRVVHLDGEAVRLQSYLHLLHQHRERLASHMDHLREAFAPFQTWEPVSSEHCSQAVQAVEAVETALHALEPLLKEEQKGDLPIVMRWLCYEVFVPLYYALEQVQETCMYLVSYRPVGQSTKIKHLQMRRQVRQRHTELLEALHETVAAMAQMEQRAFPAYERFCREVQQMHQQPCSQQQEESEG